MTASAVQGAAIGAARPEEPGEAISTMTNTAVAAGPQLAAETAEPAFPGRDFRALWTATGISQVGSAVSNVVVPLCAAVALNASAAQMTWLAAAELVPSLLIRVPAAAWSDRLRRPRAPLMAWCNLAQTVIMGLIPLLWWAGVLNFWLLLAVAVAASFALGVYSALSSPVLVRIVPKSHLVAANGKLSATRSVADIAGPALGGAILAVLAAPAAVLLDAASFLASATLLTRVRAERTPQAGGNSDGKADAAAPQPSKPKQKPAPLGVAGNFRLALAMARHSGVRAMVSVAFVNGLVQPVLVLFLIRDLHMRASLIGILLAFGAVGGVAGGMLVGRLQERFGPQRTVGLGAIASVASLALLPFAATGLSGMAGLVLLELAGSLGGTLLIATVFGGLQAAAPPDKIAQVMAMAWVLLQAASLAGVAAGGALAAGVGLRWAMAASFAVLAGTLLPQLARWALARWAPDPPIAA